MRTAVDANADDTGKRAVAERASPPAGCRTASRRRCSTSFGHFSRDGRLVFANCRAHDRVDQSDAGDEAELRRNSARRVELSRGSRRDCPGGERHTRPCRPRPPVCSRATIQSGPASPSRARRNRVGVGRLRRCRDVGRAVLANRSGFKTATWRPTVAASTTGPGYTQRQQRRRTHDDRYAANGERRAIEAGAGSSKYMILTMRR